MHYPILSPLMRRAPARSAPPPWHGLHPGADVHRVIRGGMIAILLIFGGFGTWAAMAQLAGAVIGVGVVKVDLNRKTVQHLEGGIVKEIHVRDGDRVRAGDVLVVIEDERVAASVDLLQRQLDAELAKAARLTAERDGRDTIEFPMALQDRSGDPKVAEQIRTETEFFNARRQALDAQIELLERQMDEAQKEIASLKTRSEAELAAAALLQQEIQANEALEQQHYVQKTHVLGLKRGIEEYKARRGEHLADMARAEQRISELELQIVSLRDQYLQAATEGLTTSQARVFDLQERLRPSQDMQRRQHVLAPVDGTVVNLRVFTVGGAVAPREPLMDIVPENNPLIVESQIALDAIDDVRLGQEADIRFTAYKRRDTPLVAGNVTYVSADRLLSEDGSNSYYVVHVQVDEESLAWAGNIELYPGMPAEVYIRTSERTPLDYMLSPLTNTLRRSFREP